MNVSLTRELQALVEKKVRSGLYQSASEVVREALRLLQQRDQDRQLRLDELRKAVRAGVQQADRGQVIPLDMRAVKTKARRRHQIAR